MELTEVAEGVAQMGVREFFKTKGLSDRDMAEIEAAIIHKFTNTPDLSKVLEWINQKYEGVRKDYAIFNALITLGFLNGYEKGIRVASR